MFETSEENDFSIRNSFLTLAVDSGSPVRSRDSTRLFIAIGQRDVFHTRTTPLCDVKIILFLLFLAAALGRRRPVGSYRASLDIVRPAATGLFANRNKPPARDPRPSS